MSRLLVAFAFACASFALQAQQTTCFNVADLLGFEGVQNGHPRGWRANPSEQVSSDDQVFHSDQRSVRVERQPGSAQNFAGVTLTLPVDFGGSRIQLSGFVRTEDVAGSKITFTDLTAIQIENLATFGKVWGFLKYHHPALAAGNRHWDYDLFRVLPDILRSADPGAHPSAAGRALKEATDIS